MDWLDYREKLGIGLDDEKKNHLLTVKVINALEHVAHYDQYVISDNEYYEFCNMTGTSVKPGTLYEGGLRSVIDVIKKKPQSPKEFIAYCIALINCVKPQDVEDDRRAIFKAVLSNSLKGSHIPFEVYEDGGGYYVFPKGAQEFDDPLVSEVLYWLKDYPKTQKTYTIALQQYAEGQYIRDVADNLRKALESFLQEFLMNQKSLANNIGEICKYLSEHNVDPSIGGFYKDIVKKYDSVNNDIAKHNDAVDKKILEFLLYQTGILIRMPIVVSKSE